MGKMLRMTEEEYAKRQSGKALFRQVEDLGPSLTPKPKRRKYLNEPQYFDRIVLRARQSLPGIAGCG